MRSVSLDVSTAIVCSLLASAAVHCGGLVQPTADDRPSDPAEIAGAVPANPERNVACTSPNGPPLGSPHHPEVAPPNILLIVADDLGYSDIHAFGGEIETPNLDALVENGRLLTNHHTGTVSAITRSMLMSGTDHHLVGEGTMGVPMDERRGRPGYEGHLNEHALSIAELLQDSGYHTYIAGKWHLGSGVVGSDSTLGKSPDQWGFERSYVVLGGGASNHFAHEPANARNFSADGVYVQPGQPGQPGGVGGTPPVFYSTDFYTQKLIEFIDSNHADGKPFFAFAAYTSPHWPLQVPEPWLSMYKGRYDEGYDAIRKARIERQKQLGILPAWAVPNPGAPETLTRSPASANFYTANAKYTSAVHSPEDGYVDYRGGIVNKKWESLTALEQKAQAKYMEIYAGMVSNLDHNIGLLIQHLKDIGTYDSTFIMFHSDNGAEGWPLDSGADPKTTDEANAADGVYQTLGTDNGLTNARRLQYGLRWAEVSATPFAQLKGSLGEGSVSVPAIVHLPGQKWPLPPVRAFTHVIDESATFLSLAGVLPPSSPVLPDADAGSVAAAADAGPALGPTERMVSYKGRRVFPIEGQSLLPALQGWGFGPVRPFGFGGESYGRAAVYSGDGQWKARWTEAPFGPIDGHWELFHILSDRGEVKDLSQQFPDVVERLYQSWQGYMTLVGGVEPVRPMGYF